MTWACFALVGITSQNKKSNPMLAVRLPLLVLLYKIKKSTNQGKPLLCLMTNSRSQCN